MISSAPEARTHDQLRVVQEFVRQSASLTDMRILSALVEGASRELGFDYFAILHHVRYGLPSPSHVRITSYPLDWVAVLRESGRPPDPVIRAAERTSTGFRWEELPRIITLTPFERRYMERAASFDIGHGYTVPNHVPGETFGSCHFVMKAGRPFPDDSMPAAQALGNFAFEAARRILASTGPMANYVEPAPLSERQRECLLFVARGKSDSVIAQLLGITSGTVNEHIEKAKRRYAVATRSQLLVKALFRSEICFSEVLT
jgi:LuxR family quorum-sensing system transcriptional regulator CciR